MSSDSEEDIFGNAAKKLKILCSKSVKNDSCEIISDSTDIDRIINGVSTSTSFNNLTNLNIDVSEIDKHVKSTKKTDYPSDLSDECDTEWFAAIRQNAKRRSKCRKSKRLKIANSNKPVNVANDINSNTDNSLQESIGTKKKTKQKTKLTKQNRRGNGNTSNICDSSSQTTNLDTLVNPVRGLRQQSRRNRGRGRQQATCHYPTYNIGNTEEYTDKSEDIPLFSSKPIIPPINEIVISDEDSDENEELSVHVHWQNYEVFKFNIRKFQKIREIFEFFAKRENVPEKRLFFAYNDVVLTCDDTPNSMKYNIAKFIEGGIISQDLINLVREHTSIKSSGIQIKFQGQNFKRPYEISVQPNDKLSLAMVKCAEHFEKPLDNLRFEFDGERISGTTTAKELELENGDCIDVRISK